MLIEGERPPVVFALRDAIKNARSLTWFVPARFTHQAGPSMH